MTIAYKWVAETLFIFPEYQGKNDVVFSVFWRRIAEDGDYAAELCGEQQIEVKISDAFVSFENLTFNQVVGWLESAIGAQALDDIDSRLTNMISEKINPSTLSVSPPWSQ